MANQLTGLHNGAATGAINALSAHGRKAEEAVGQLSTGKKNIKASSNAAERAIATNVSIQKDTLKIANDGTVKASAVLSVAASLIESDIGLLKEMKALATISAGADLDPSKRALLDKAFQNLKNQIASNETQGRWGASSLLSGGGGTLTAATDAGAAAGSGLAAVANAFAGTLASAAGFITGVVESVSVSAGAGSYEVSVMVGGQEFRASAEVPAGGGTLNLFSVTDPGNVIRLDYAAAVTAITNSATFKSTLEQSLGLVGGAAKAQFTSASTAAVGVNGVTAVNNSANTPQGSYALSYGANSGQLRLTDGLQVWTAAIATTGAAQTVQFDNGVSVSFDNTFDATVAIGQAVFSVGAGTGTTLSIQTGDKSTDTLSFTLPVATLQGLNLLGIDVLSPANAATASATIDQALTGLQQSSADVGAFIKRLETVSDALTATIANLDAALQVYDDVDMPEAMARLLQATAMEKASYRAITDSLARLTDQTNFIQNAR